MGLTYVGRVSPQLYRRTIPTHEMPEHNPSIAQRAQASALYEVGLSLTRFRAWTRLGRSTVFDIHKLAVQKGYDRITNHVFQGIYFWDAPRRGRPKALKEEALGKYM